VTLGCGRTAGHRFRLAAGGTHLVCRDSGPSGSRSAACRRAGLSTVAKASGFMDLARRLGPWFVFDRCRRPGARPRVGKDGHERGCRGKRRVDRLPVPCNHLHSTGPFVYLGGCLTDHPADGE